MRTTQLLAKAEDEQVSILIEEGAPQVNFTFDNFTQSFHLTLSQIEIKQLHTMLANEGNFQFEAPANDEQTLNSKDSDKWEVARMEELHACKSNSTWGKLRDLPKGKKFVNLGFIYNIKRSGEDIPPRYKARLVYKNHQHGIKYIYICTSSRQSYTSNILYYLRAREIIYQTGRCRDSLSQRSYG